MKLQDIYTTIWLTDLVASTEESTPEDDLKMYKCLQDIGFKQSFVTSGIVYENLEGRALPIKHVAKRILEEQTKLQDELSETMKAYTTKLGAN
tara:strand:- start:232 stop:510 length:279 start_codon:yes stop_codon:yes gene_type:complete